ncbi:MAG: tetratricopeptide repeat protein [Xenococcus sp. (in: cyanobacteria)]
MTNADKKELKKKLKRIKQQNLNKEEKAIKSSLLYVEYSLLDKAIKGIEKLALTGSQNTKLHLILGDLWSIQKNYPLAIKSYKKAIKTASKSKNRNFQEMSIIAEMELANCMLKQAKKKSESLPKMGERLTELVNKQQNLLENRSNRCPCRTKISGQPGRWRWTGVKRCCIACLFSDI